MHLNISAGEPCEMYLDDAQEMGVWKVKLK